MKLYLRCQKVKLVGLQDRRRKLTDDDKEDIREQYASGAGVREIARAYAGVCSRRLIQFTLFPERLQKMQKKHAKEQHWKKYHNRKKLTDAIRSWRNYKYALFKDKIK